MKYLCLAAVLLCCSAIALGVGKDEAKMKCSERYEQEMSYEVPEGWIKLFIPKCTPEGDYEPFQCYHPSYNTCFCWRPDGTTIKGPSSVLKTCDCHVHLDRANTQAEQGMVGQMFPTCNEDGTYAKKQCSGSTGYCWCSDEKGTMISEEVRGHIEC